ncbi:hypothetical protein HQ584_01870 [Patescibacteria group bacterium]|nr:hypothetical protein [Patescibacteria group bacterium]
MPNKINVILNYDYGEEDIDFEFEDIDGDSIGEAIGQSSCNELIDGFRELEEEALIQLVDENGKVLKERKIKIEF